MPETFLVAEMGMVVVAVTALYGLRTPEVLGAMVPDGRAGGLLLGAGADAAAGAAAAEAPPVPAAGVVPVAAAPAGAVPASRAAFFAAAA